MSETLHLKASEPYTAWPLPHIPAEINTVRNRYPAQPGDMKAGEWEALINHKPGRLGRG